MSGLSKQESKGEAIYQKNCAFCHAHDGTGRNWFGAFLHPHPRNLTGSEMDGMTWDRLKEIIKQGLPGSSMSAWKSVLSDDEMDAVIAYISRAFHPIAKKPASRRASIDTSAGG